MEPEIPRVARAQGGVFTRAQAVDAGWSRQQVTRALSRGRLHRVAGAGLSTAAAPFEARALAWSSALTWPDGVVATRVAASLQALPVALGDGRSPGAGTGTLVEVYTRCHRREVRGLRPLRRPLARDEIERRGELALTSRRRTVIDCLAWLPWSQALDLYAWTSTRAIFGRADLQQALHERTGQHGIGQLRQLWTRTATGAVSAAEEKLHQLLRQAGISGWRAGVKITDDAGVIAVVDLFFEAQALVVEVDGHRAHSDHEAFVRDRRRQNRLVNAGYRVLRFTWSDLTSRPGSVIAQIRAALAC